MTTRLIYKIEVRHNIFVICTQRGDEYQVQYQHDTGIKYQTTNDAQRATEIIRQYVDEASEQTDYEIEQLNLQNEMEHNK